MEPNSVSDAIAAHLAWVKGFRDALNAVDTRDFDLDKAYDHTACVLGRWLQSDAGRKRLPPRSFSEIDHLHRQFHESAFVIASIFRKHMQPRDIAPFVTEFEGLSGRLVDLLQRSQDPAGPSSPSAG